MEASKFYLLVFVLIFWIGMAVSDDYDYNYNSGDAQSPSEYQAYGDYAPSNDYNYDNAPSYGDYGNEAEQCNYLESNMVDDFRSCCKYPDLAIEEDLYMECVMKCSELEDKAVSECCSLSCSFESMGIVQYTRDDRGVAIESSGIDLDSFINSLAQTVDFDESWVSVLTESSKKCVDQYFTLDGQRDCDIIPSSLFDVINCIYVENLLNCPYWNPDDNYQCENTRQYAEKCMNPKAEDAY